MVNIATFNELSPLERIAELRLEMKQYEKLIAEIMPDAIEEAMSNFNGKNSTVFDTPTVKIVLKQVKEYDSPKNNGDLYTIDHEIKEETKRLEKIHELELKLIDEQIEQFQQHKDSLLSSDTLNALNAEYKQTLEGTLNFKPQLAVTIK